MGMRLLNLAAVASLPAVPHLACSISPLPLPLPSRSLPQYQTTAPAVQIVAAVPDEQRLDVVERAAAARRRRRALAHLHDGRPLVRVGLGSAVAVTEAVVGDELDDVRLLRLRLERLAAASVAGRRDSPGLHGPRTCRSSASGGPSGGSGTRARVAYGAAEQRRRATARASRRRRWPVVSSGKSSCEHASGREEDGAGLGALVVLVAVVGAAKNNGDKLGLELATMAPTRSSREGEGAEVAAGESERRRERSSRRAHRRRSTGGPAVCRGERGRPAIHRAKTGSGTIAKADTHCIDGLINLEYWEGRTKHQRKQETRVQAASGGTQLAAQQSRSQRWLSCGTA